MASAETGVSGAAYDEGDALERMLDDGGPVPLTSRPAHRASVRVVVEPSAEERAAERRAARYRFRVYCLACGRAAESSTVVAHARQARCGHCGGTVLVEPATD